MPKVYTILLKQKTFGKKCGELIFPQAYNAKRRNQRHRRDYERRTSVRPLRVGRRRRRV